MTTFYRHGIDGVIKDFEDDGFQTLQFEVSSPSFDFAEIEANSISGYIPTDKKRQATIIDITFLAKVDSYEEIALKRQLFFNIVSDTPIYIIEDRKGGEMWECYLRDNFTMTEEYKALLFTASLICFSGRSISVESTTSEVTFDKLHYYNLPTNVDNYKDIEKVAFKIFNPGIAIDPRDRNSHLKITYQGVASNFGIINLTTNETYEYHGNLLDDDELVIDGIDSYKNGKSVFLDTNKRLITLAPGWNDIVLKGVPGAIDIDNIEEFEDVEGDYPITFDFRFNFN